MSIHLGSTVSPKSSRFYGVFNDSIAEAFVMHCHAVHIHLLQLHLR
jgi:hypothetical protein